MTTDCRRSEDDLKAYADGELPLARRLAVRRHLSRCAACRKELTAMQQISEDLRAAEGTDTLAPDLRAKILASPAAPNSGATAPGGGAGREAPRRPSRAWQLAGAGAIALLAWAVLFPVFHPAHDYARQIALRSLQYTQDNDEAVPASAAARAPRQQMEKYAAGPAALEAPTRQVHKEATIGVQVDDAEATGDQVAQMVKTAGGFVASNTLSTNGDGSKSADLTVKVPVVQFETVLGQVAKLGDVQSKNVTGEDITEKTSDADQAEGVLEDEARRADARLAALGKKAGWRDQQADQDARIQLAQARARLVLLKKMAALSTLSIGLTERPKPAAPAPVTSGFLGGLGDTTRAATGSLLASAGTLLALLIWTLAYAPLWLPLALIGRFFYRRFRRTAA